MSHIRFSFVSNQVSAASNCGCSSPRPILCEMLEHKDEEEKHEKQEMKRIDGLLKEADDAIQQASNTLAIQPRNRTNKSEVEM